MPDEEKVPVWADALLRRFDSLDSRLQGLEVFRADSEKEAEERKAKDAEESEKKRKDAESGEERKKAAESEERDLKGEFEAKDGESEEEMEKRLEERHDSFRKDCSMGRKDGESEEEFSRRVDSTKRRLDSFEKMRKDRKDAVEEAKKASEQAKSKEEEMRQDSELSRENKAMRARLDELESTVKRQSEPLSATDRDELAKAQARADALSQHFGEHALAPLAGETPISYRRRLAAKFQKHSDKLKNLKLDSIGGEAFDVIEDQIYADAATVANNPALMTAGRLIEHVHRDQAGREIKTYSGDMNAWLGAFKMSKNPVSFKRSQNLH